MFNLTQYNEYLNTHSLRDRTVGESRHTNRLTFFSQREKLMWKTSLKSVQKRDFSTWSYEEGGFKTTSFDSKSSTLSTVLGI